MGRVRRSPRRTGHVREGELGVYIWKEFKVVEIRNFFLLIWYLLLIYIFPQNFRSFRYNLHSTCIKNKPTHQPWPFRNIAKETYYKSVALQSQIYIRNQKTNKTNNKN